MNKKHLVTLLVLPLLLTSCGGDKEPEPNPGEKGEDVLTVEQKADILANDKPNEYNRTIKYLEHSAYEYDVADGWTSLYSTIAPFHVYEKVHSTGTVEWAVVSDLVGSVDLGGKPQGYTVTHAFTAYRYSFLFDATSIYYLKYSAAYESAGYKKNYNEVRDQFGNTIYSSAKWTDDENVTNVAARVNTVTLDLLGNTETEYLLDVTIRNYVDNTTTVKTLKYGPDFSTLTAYQDSSSPLSVRRGLKYTFTDDEIKYTVEGVDNGLKVSHTEKSKKEEKVVTNYFTVPAGADIKGALLGHNYVYQQAKPLNEHNGEYNLAKDDGTLYLVKTYRANLITMETEEIEFPYEITTNFDTSYFMKDQYKGKLPTEVTTPKYAVVKLNKIENKRVTGHELRYVVDQNLALRDELTAYDTSFIPFGNEHYRKSVNGDLCIYDKDFKLVNVVKDFEVDNNRSGFNYLSGQTFANKWGVVGEDGKFIIEPHYESCLFAGYTSNYLCFVDGDERFLFNTDTLKGELYYREPGKTSDIIDETYPYYLYILRGEIPEGGSEYDPDYVCFGNQKLVSFAHTTNNYSRFYYYSYSYNGSTYRWNIYRYTNADGNQVTFTILVSSVKK